MLVVVSARERVAGFWDEHVAAWLDGDDPMAEPLLRWFDSYRGRGADRVTREGFPEPYAGDLLGLARTPRVVVLGLNPGQYHPRFQARVGIFADEIRRCGSFSAWMTTGPYLRVPWTDEIGPNVYYRSRISFAARWLDDPMATHHDLLIFEAYPWHSTAVTAPLRPPADIIDTFVWQPIAELPIREVFAFGRPWNKLVNALGLSCTTALGAGGHPYGSAVPSRAIRRLRTAVRTATHRRMARRKCRTPTSRRDRPPEGGSGPSQPPEGCSLSDVARAPVTAPNHLRLVHQRATCGIEDLRCRLVWRAHL